VHRQVDERWHDPLLVKAHYRVPSWLISPERGTNAGTTTMVTPLTTAQIAGITIRRQQGG
jgi:hypothetical protein